MNPAEFLRGCRELKIPQFLAGCPADVHVVAPGEILDAARQIRPDRPFSHSTEWSAISDEVRNILVYDQVPGSPSSQIRARYRHANVYTINFDVALRLASGKGNLSDWRDAELREPQLKYCILCTPRSGSTLLTSLLAQLGFGRPLEHLRLPVANLIAKGGYSFDAVMHELCRVGARNGIFGTKLISEFLLQIFREVDAAELGKYLSRSGYRIIHLKRNRYEQVVSWHFAAHTRVWHLRDDASIPSRNVSYDFGLLKNLYDRFEREEQFLQNVLACVPEENIFRVDYEALDNDPKALARAAATFLNPGHTSQKISLSRAPKKISVTVPLMDEFRHRLEADFAAVGDNDKSRREGVLAEAELPLNTIVLHNEFGAYCVPRECLHRPRPKNLSRGEVHERETIEFLIRNAKNGSIVHAGTFFGDFLPALSHAIAPGGRIFAFEPNPRSFECAKATMRLNGLENIVLMHCGLADVDGESSGMVRAGKNVALGGASALALDDNDARGSVTVPVRRLDGILPEDADISIIQLDVEKFEWRALAGALQTIRRARPILVLKNLPEGSWISDNLAPLGYRRRGRVGPKHVLAPI